MITLQYIITSDSIESAFREINRRVLPDEIARFLQEVKQLLQERALSRFSSESDGVTPWRPLAEATNEIRESLGYPREHPINVRSGELKSFMTSSGDVSILPDGASLLYPSEPTSFIASKYETAQKGSSKTGAPPRPVFAFNEFDAEMVLSALAGHITGGPL